jgi:hypothetical protein
MQSQEQIHHTLVVEEVVEMVDQVLRQMVKVVELVVLVVVEMLLRVQAVDPCVMHKLEQQILVEVVELLVLTVVKEQQVVQVSWSQERRQVQELFFKQHQVE